MKQFYKVFFHEKSISKSFILILNILTHFDSTMYFVLAPILAPIFFPKHDATIQLILVYGVQIISIFAKPLGSILFGMLAVKKNPIIVLSYGITGLGCSGLFIALLSDASKIGCLAPLSLIFCRTISIICCSGCNTIAKTYLIDSYKITSPLRAMYLYNFTSMLGTILSLILSLIGMYYSNVSSVIPEGLCWRVGFVLISFISFILLFILRKYKISNFNQAIYDFKLIKTTKQIFLEIWQQKYNLFKISIVLGATHISYVLAFGFFNKFIPLITEINFQTMLKLNCVFCGFDFLILFILSSLFINYKSQTFLLVSSLCLAGSILPMFLMLNNASIFTVILIGLWIIFWGIIFDCQANVWCYAIVSRETNKYLLLGLGTALGGSLIGKSMASVCWYLWYTHKSMIAPAIYLIILLSLASACIFISKTKIFDLQRN